MHDQWWWWLTKRLPWRAGGGSYDAPVIRNFDGSYQASFVLKGQDVKNHSQAVKGAAMANANNALQRMGTGWAIYTDAQRGAVLKDTRSRYAHQVAQRVEDERVEAFTKPGAHFQSTYHVTLGYKPPPKAVSRIEAMWVQGRAPGKTSQAHWEADTFRTKAHHFATLLGGNGALTPMNADETWTFLHHRISGKRQKVKWPDVPLDLNYKILDTSFRGGYDIRLGRDHVRVVSIIDMPDRSVADVLYGLNALGFEYEWCTRYMALPRPEARKIMKHTQAQYWASRRSVTSWLVEMIFGAGSVIEDSDAKNKAGSADQALQAIGTGTVGYGYMSDVLIVRHHDPRQADAMVQAIDDFLEDQECVSAREDMGAMDAWLGSHPGNRQHNTNQPMVSSWNRVHFMPGLICPYLGERWNPHLKGPALTTGTTEGSNPFWLNTHVDDTGHWAILGPVGAGKTYHMLYNMAQFFRYDTPDQEARGIIFAVKGGGRALTLCMGGTWIDLGKMTKALQPLGRLETKAQWDQAIQWLYDRLEEAHEPLTGDVRAYVETGLKALRRIDRRERSITRLMHEWVRQSRETQMYGSKFTDKNAVMKMQAAVRKVIEFYQNTLLDGNHDVLTDGVGCASRIQGFEWETILESPRLLLPTLSYVWPTLEQGFTGMPVLFLWDEFNRYSKHPSMVKRADQAFRLYRDRNIVIGLGTQALEDILVPELGTMIEQSCLTRLYPANAAAQDTRPREAYEMMGVTAQSIQQIGYGTRKQDYLFQQREDHPEHQRMYRLQATPTAIALCGRSTRADHRLMDRILEEHGLEDFWRYWLPAQGVACDQMADNVGDALPPHDTALVGHTC